MNRTVFSGYTGRQMLMIWLIGSFEEPPNLGTLAKRANCSHQNIRVILNNLEESGCLVMPRSTTDGRSVIVKLTEKGRYIDTKIDSAMSRIEGKLSELVSEEDAEAFVRVARKLDEVVDFAFTLKGAGDRKHSEAELEANA